MRKRTIGAVVALCAMALLLSSCLSGPDIRSADGASDYRGIFPPSVRTVGVVMPAASGRRSPLGGAGALQPLVLKLV